MVTWLPHPAAKGTAHIGVKCVRLQGAARARVRGLGGLLSSVGPFVLRLSKFGSATSARCKRVLSSPGLVQTAARPPSWPASLAACGTDPVVLRTTNPALCGFRSAPLPWGGWSRVPPPVTRRWCSPGARAALVTVKDGVRLSFTLYLPATMNGLAAQGVARAHVCICLAGPRKDCPACLAHAHLSMLRRLFPRAVVGGSFHRDFPLFPDVRGLLCKKKLWLTHSSRPRASLESPLCRPLAARPSLAIRSASRGHKVLLSSAPTRGPSS